MRVLFSDLFEDASVLATNQSLNYPVANITHPFLHKRFQSTTTTSVVTATWDTDQCMSCLFYGFHTLTSLIAVYKDSSGTTIKTLSLTELEDIGVEYFDKISVRSVEITLTGDSGFYLGKVAGGCCYSMPDVNADYESGNTDNSNGSSSSYGQRLVNNIPKLRDLSYSFRELSLDLKNEIDALYTSSNIFFDLYENNRDKEPPIYGYLSEPFNFTYNARKYSLSIKIGEAK